MFFFFRQIVLDALALQMRRQRPPSARAGLILIATAGAGREIVVLFGIGLRFRRRLDSAEFLRELLANSRN